jgi:beta-glucosidase
VGYRHFATKDVEVAYPFGYGLSYTRFEYGELKLSAPTFDGELTATVSVTNAGDAAGREIVQLYLEAPTGSVPRPALELKGFSKTKLLEPGESETLSFRLAPRDLARFDEGSSSWVADAGVYTVKVGASSADVRRTAGFSLEREEVVGSVSTAVGAGGQ